MKKIFYFIAAVPFILGSCSQEEFIENNQDLNNNSQASNVLLAGIENNATSRVGIDNTGKVTWSAGDAFTAFDANNQSATYTLATGEEGKESAKFQSDKAISPAFAFYPSSIITSIEGDLLNVTLPEEIDASQSQNAPMMGTISQNAVQFSQITSMIKLNFEGLPAGFDKIKIRSNKNIAGVFSINIKNSSDFSLKPIKENSLNHVIIKNIENGKDYYISIPSLKSEKETINQGEATAYDCDVIHELHISALNSKNPIEEIQLITVGNKELKAKHLYTIKARTYTPQIIKYNKDNYVDLTNPNYFMNEAPNKWFGISGTPGTSKGLDEYIELTTNSKTSWYKGGACGYYSTTFNLNRSLYKITFKAQASNESTLNVLCRAGNEFDSNFKPITKWFYPTTNRLTLAPLRGIIKDNLANGVTSTLIKASEEFNEYYIFVNLQNVIKGNGSKILIEEVLPEICKNSGYEVRFFPKEENGATIRVKDIEISEVVYTSMPGK